MKRTEKFVALYIITYLLKVALMSSVSMIGQYLLAGGAAPSDLTKIAELSGVIVSLLPRLICATWLSSEARARGESHWLWSAFGWVGELIAVLVFFALVLSRRTDEEGRANKPPEAMAVKCPPSNQSQSPAMPHL